MEDFKTGDILLLEDGTPWEFLRYAYGKITVRADNIDFRGGPGIDKAYAHVRPLKPKTNLVSDIEARDIATHRFRIAPADYILDDN